MGSSWWALVLLALALSGCGGCEPPQQSAVNVPTTIAAAKKLHDPPSVVVSVERKKKAVSGGGGGCGHSALCVLILPAVLLAPLFPEKWDEVRVVRGGELFYTGRFHTDGRFLEATVREKGSARSIGVLPLANLDRHVIVELARAPIGPSGEVGAYVRTPILPQVDLAKEYETRLARLREPEKRADLVIEYATWLKDESLPWLTHIVPKEAPDSAGRVLVALCATYGDHPWEPGCGAVLDAIAAKPTPKLASLALQHSADRGSAKRSLGLGRYLVGVGCEGDAVDAMEGLRRVRNGVRSDQGAADGGASPMSSVRDDLAAAARACKAPHRVHLSAALGEHIEEPEVARELTPVGRESELLANVLATDVPSHRRGLLTAISARLDAGTEEEPLVRWLARSGVAPDAGELAVLTKSYVRRGGADAARRRACAVERFARAGHETAAIARARAAVRLAMEGAPEPERPAFSAALVHLGERDQAGMAIGAFTGAIFVPHACGDVTDDNALAGFALFRAGCEPSEALALQRAAKRDRGDGGATAARPATPGPLCTRPKAKP